MMPCLFAVLALLFPRIAIAVLYFFTTFFQGVYESVLIPLLGFIFLPLSLLAYTWLTKNGYPVDAFFLVVMFVALVIDLGLVGGAGRGRRA
jgi:hypothetical protein